MHASVGEHTQRVLGTAADFVRFCDEEPGLASVAGLETCALEARLALGYAGERRHMAGAPWAKDLEIVSRIEAVLATAGRRIEAHLAEEEREERGRAKRSMGDTIFLATAILGAIGAVA